MKNASSTNRFFLLLVLSGMLTRAVAQKTITYYDHILPIINIHCMPCHAENGAANFSLAGYEDVKKSGKLVSLVITNRRMPPCKTDPAYRHFADDNFLSNAEIELFHNWISGGFMEGAKRKVVSEKVNVAKPDLVIEMVKPCVIPGDNQDHYVSWVTPLNLKQDIYVTKIQVIPGNRKRVHHIRVDADTLRAINQKADKFGFINTLELDTIQKVFAVPFLASYVPGLGAYTYPEGSGRRVFKNSQLLFNIHYAPGTVEETDVSKILIYYSTTVPDTFREVKVLSYGFGTEIENLEKLKIPKDSLFSTGSVSKPCQSDLSIISVQPHMHRLGKSVKMYAVTPKADTIPIIYIPEWDFNWQNSYYLPELLFIPVGSHFIMEGEFNNTGDNPSNPFFPPQDVFFAGMRTQDEMFICILQALEYKSGDELIKYKQ